MTPEKNALMKMNSEDGFVLVFAMLMLLLLTLIGISALNTSNMEIQIGGNDRMRKQGFSQADGGTQLGVRLVEESLGARSGFVRRDPTTNVLQDPDTPNNTVAISTSTLWANLSPLPVVPSEGPPAVRDAAYYPEGFNPLSPGAPHTNITMNGQDTVPNPGSGNEMFAPPGTPGSQGSVLYTILSQHVGMLESESLVEAVWRHMNGQELPRRY